MTAVNGNLRRLMREAKTVYVLRCTADATITDGHVEVDVEVLGTQGSEAIADVCGGVGAPFGLPREGDVWLGAAIGQGLEDVYAMVPIIREEEEFPSPPDNTTQWSPRPGEDARVFIRDGGSYTVEVEAASVPAVSSIFWTVGGLEFRLSSDGRILLGNASVDVVDALHQTLQYLDATLGDLGTTTVATMLGPQPLLTGPLFTARRLETSALLLLLNQIKAV